ncbi:hypothetical protein F5X99DRAFT_83577 [Biscogniauxia marginata]|nr:hypothetical protein F5X99DRAFT_83577 [Biscogniauxia marginata]
MHYFSGITTSLACFVAVAAASPITGTSSYGQLNRRQPVPSSSAAAAACPTGSARAAPTLYNLYPARPDAAEAPVTHIEVQSTSSETETREQAMVVRGVPAEAKTCTVIWIQAEADERNFVVSGNGLTSVLQLNGFPADGESISYGAVQPYIEASTTPERRHADFTRWDLPQYGAANHTLGPYSCAENMYFHLSIDKEESGEGHVYFDQDDKNGFFVEYSC